MILWIIAVFSYFPRYLRPRLSVAKITLNFRFSSSSARQTAGKTCPPVPPAAITIVFFNFVLQISSRQLILALNAFYVFPIWDKASIIMTVTQGNSKFFQKDKKKRNWFMSAGQVRRTKRKRSVTWREKRINQYNPKAFWKNESPLAKRDNLKPCFPFVISSNIYELSPNPCRYFYWVLKYEQSFGDV